MLDIDDIIFQKAKNKDIKAFEEFIIGYEKLIYNVVFKIIGNRDDAKDISQEVLIKIYKNFHKCKDKKSFKSWMYKIINNTCIDEFRKRKGKDTFTLDESLDLKNSKFKNEIPTDTLTPLEEIIQKETVLEVQLAINVLSYNHKILIILRDINGLTYDEISEITNLSLGTVKSRLSRARKALKDILIKNREQKQET